jgi:hypothetical protein
MGDNTEESSDFDEPYAAAPRPGSRHGGPSPYADLLAGDSRWPAGDRTDEKPEPLENELDVIEAELIDDAPEAAPGARADERWSQTGQGWARTSDTWHESTEDGTGATQHRRVVMTRPGSRVVLTSRTTTTVRTTEGTGTTEEGAAPPKRVRFTPGGGDGRPARPGRYRPILGRAVRKLLLLLVLLAVVLVVSRACAHRDEPAAPRDAAPAVDRPDATGEVGATWHVEATALRPDLSAPRLVGAVDGAFDGPYVADLTDVWVLTSGSEQAQETVLHALDPASGDVVWERALDGVLCATEAHAAGLPCASVLERDPGTGLGVRWQLHLIDPGTGEDLAAGEVEAWVTAVRLVGDTFVLLEQRQPAPHAVLRGFGTDLEERWTLDLAGEPGHEGLFSENRVVNRPEPERPGLALDRPRLREVGPGLLAVWSGMRTAVVTPGPGDLLAMPQCSRLVDDGERLWCNEPESTAAYSYAGDHLFTVPGLRLAFPDHDGRGDDRTRPVFIDEDGDVYSVDGESGEVRRRYLRAGTGSAFGMTIMPGASWTDGHTLVDHGTGVALLAPQADEVAWTNELAEMSDPPIARGDDLVLGGHELVTLDLATGVETSRVRQPYGLYTVAVGGEIVGVGPDEIARLDLP